MKDYEMGDQPIQIPLGLFLEIRDELFELRKLKEEKEQKGETPSEDRTLIVDIEFLKANSLNGYTPDEPLIGDIVESLVKQEKERLTNLMKIEFYIGNPDDNKYYKRMLEIIKEINEFLLENRYTDESHRSTGRTTHLSNLYSSWLMMAKKGDWIEIKDHWPLNHAAEFASKELAQRVAERVKKERGYLNPIVHRELPEGKLFIKLK